MGCHTWCYAHIPEKAQEWNHEYAETLVNNCSKYIKMWEKTSKEYLDKQAKEENEENEERLNLYHELEENGTIYDDVINMYFDGNKQKYDAYIELISKKITGDELMQRQIQYEKNTIDVFKQYGEDHVIDFILDNQNRNDMHTYDIFKFGLFKIKDRKIYRDTCHYRGKHHGEDYVFDDRFHDIFRIHDYEANPCYSLEETLQRCEEYNIDWDACYPNTDIKINNIERLKTFWKKYPDGIIEFG